MPNTKSKTLLAQVKASYKKYKQPIRGFLGWVGGLVLQIVTQAGGYEQVQNWNRPRWIAAFVAAAIPGVALWMKGGDTNPTDEEIYEKVHRVKKQRAEAGLEVTDPNGLQLKKTGPA